MFHKLLIGLALILFVLCGCAQGRGDWKIDLISGYAIDCVNSHEIVLTFKDDPDQVGAEIVIENYYITAYWTKSNYIGLEGIPTNALIATDQELNSGSTSYYLVNTHNAEIVGPFDSYEQFITHCQEIELIPPDTWTATQ